MSNDESFVKKVDTPIPHTSSTNSPQVDTASILSTIGKIRKLMDTYDESGNAKSAKSKEMLLNSSIDISLFYNALISSDDDRYRFLGTLKTLLDEIQSICDPNRTETMQKLPPDLIQ
jgi:hypothetical protein